jgi:hypothetical protein
MFRFCRTASIVLPLIASTLFAAVGPKIEFDTKDFKCGNVLEGKTDKLNAVFIVKNTGDSLLKLENVKPGCGCTVVKYDTFIQPGKTAKIEAQVTIKGHSSGAISKNVTVTSNAKNEPSVRLTIEATVQSIIDVSETYLMFDAKNAKTPHTIYCSSKMADLKVTEVSFKATGTPGTPAWQSEIPLATNFKWLPTDSTRADGYHVYKLELFSPDVKTAVTGELVVKTNHPDKPEISLTVNIQK